MLEPLEAVAASLHLLHQQVEGVGGPVGGGRPDRYVLFRRESEMAHVGAIALGQMVENQAEDQVRLCGPSPVGDRARKLGVVLETMADITEIIVSELGLDQEAWQELRRRRQDELVQLIGPIIGIEPDPG